MGGRGTFRRRIAISMALLAIVVLTAAGAAVYVGARHALERNLDEALLAMARAEVASSMDAPGGALHVHEQPGGLSLAIGSGFEKFAEIRDAAGRSRARTSNLSSGPELRTDREREARAIEGNASFGDARRDGEAYRAVYYPLRSASGERLVAIVAVPSKPLATSLDLLLVAVLAAVTVGGVASAVAAARIAGRLVRPLEEIAEASRSVVGRPDGERFPEVSGDQEIRTLVAILNEMLGRLDSAMEAQRRFVADASHELRTPLSNLRGTIEVALRRSRSAEEYRAILERSLAEVERLSRLVTQLLTLSRADAGRLVVGAERCDLARVAREAGEACEARARDRGVELRIDASEPVAIVGDADRLREVADNLLDNALRLTPPGRRIEIAAKADDLGPSLSVTDGGPGVASADRVRIFDRFYRAERSRNRDTGGAGLGLAIAKAIVDAHHGEISVRANEVGSTFTMRLPSPTP